MFSIKYEEKMLQILADWNGIGCLALANNFGGGAIIVQNNTEVLFKQGNECIWFWFA